MHQPRGPLRYVYCGRSLPRSLSLCGSFFRPPPSPFLRTTALSNRPCQSRLTSRDVQQPYRQRGKRDAQKPSMVHWLPRQSVILRRHVFSSVVSSPPSRGSLFRSIHCEPRTSQRCVIGATTTAISLGRKVPCVVATNIAQIGQHTCTSRHAGLAHETGFGFEEASHTPQVLL